MHRKAPIPIHAILHEEDCELFVRISITRPRRPVAMVSAITSPDQTGAKVYYQSGPGLVSVRRRSPSAANVHASHSKMKLALTRTTEP